MTRKPNFWKCILGVLVLSLLVIATWATTRPVRTTAAGSKHTVDEQITINKNNAVVHPNPLNVVKTFAQPAPSPTPAWDAVFEIDGNADDDVAAPVDDWNDFLPGTVSVGTTSETKGAGPPGHADVWTFITDPPISTDLIYTGGSSKDFRDVTDWRQVAKGTGPPKDDVEHAFAAKYGKVLVFGGDRPTNNGDANIGFWFFQDAVAPITSGPDAGKFTGQHRNGDIFVLSAFANGGTLGHVRVLVWVGEDPSTALSVCTNTFGGVIDPKSDTTAFPQGSLCELPQAGGNTGTGITNAGTISVSWQYTNKDTKENCTSAPCSIPTPDFFEGAMDLSTLPSVANECFASFLLETRSSDEVSAVLKDFALGGFEACNLECSKVAAPSPVCDGSPITYTYTAEIPTGSQSMNVTLRDDIGSDNDTSNDFFIIGKNPDGSCMTSTIESSFALAGGTSFSCTLSVSNLSVGTHKDTLHVVGTNNNGDVLLSCDSDEVTVVVNPNPTASATPTASACENPGFTSHDFSVSGSVTNGTPSWSIVGANTANCSIFSGGSTTSAVVRCTAFGTSTARLTSTSDQTPSCGTATADVAITLNPNATANAGTPQTVCETTGFGTHTFNMSGSASNGTPSWTIEGANTANCSVFSGGDTTTPVIKCTAFGNATARLLVTSNNGCSNAQSDVLLTINQNPVITIADVSCNAASGGTSLSLQAVVSAGGGATPTYLWSGPSGGISAGQGTDTITVIKPGTYTVQVTNGGTSCTASKSKNVGLCAADAAP